MRTRENANEGFSAIHISYYQTLYSHPFGCEVVSCGVVSQVEVLYFHCRRLLFLCMGNVYAPEIFCDYCAAALPSNGKDTV